LVTSSLVDADNGIVRAVVAPLQVLVPMAGRGQRFRNSGVVIPKPLIPVQSRPMFEHALDGLADLRRPWTLTCVVLAEHQREHGMRELITDAHPGARVVEIESVTGGSADTCLAAAGILDGAAPLLVLDCDITFRSAEFLDAVDSAIDTGSADAVLLWFPSSDPRFSYAELDSEGRVTRTAEKQAISSHALGGAYFFARASEFVTAATELAKQPLDSRMPEHYLSAVVNALVADGKRCVARPGSFTSLGTPEELAAYLAVSTARRTD
jgi:NDP-sugar pyrophosphorylase family protein